MVSPLLVGRVLLLFLVLLLSSLITLPEEEEGWGFSLSSMLFSLAIDKLSSSSIYIFRGKKAQLLSQR
jgi:hypothetical protein